MKDGEAWYTAVCGVTKSWTQLSEWTITILESINSQGELRKYLSLSDNMEIIFCTFVVKEFLDVINF